MSKNEVIVNTVNGFIRTFICQRCREVVLPLTKCSCILNKLQPLQCSSTT